MDDDAFRKAMSSLGVTPLDRHERQGKKRPRSEATAKPAPRPAGERPSHEPEIDDEDALFLASMQGLFEIPDKDRTSSRPSSATTRRLRAPKKAAVTPEAVLDLHGCTTAQALDRLRSFLTSSRSQRLETVLVVTGKGLRSERGVSVVRDTVEHWLPRQGRTWVRAYSEAPRALGGRGAFLLHLRPHP